MKTFAFLIHPITIGDVKDFWPITRIMPDRFIKSFLKMIPPFRVSRIRKVRSNQGKEIQGYFIGCPLLPKPMMELREEFILDKIISAGHIAERLGAGILGLGGYTSIVADKGHTIAKKLKIPVTSGSTFTAWSVFEAIYRMAKIKNIDIEKSTLAIVGATGSIGSLCARKLADYVEKIIITARHRDKLERLKAILHQLSPVGVIIEEDAHKAVKDADIVITTTGSPEALLDIKEFKPNTIICDVSVPRNVAGKTNSRHDISLIDGGLIKLPHPADFGVDTGLPKDIIYACMAETMLLTLEGKFKNYSLGDNINLDQMEEIADIAMQHGFQVWVPDAPVL